MNLVILTEEPSMQTALEHLLPKIGVDMACVTIIPHQGKSDLEASIPRKLRAWRAPNTRFLVLRDNDGGDCIARKAHLLSLVNATGKGHNSKVRIICQELEAWFLADLPALVAAGYVASGKQPAFSRRDPDRIGNPAQEMKRLRSNYGKVTGADQIAPHMDPANTRSASFHHTIKAIQELMAA